VSSPTKNIELNIQVQSAREVAQLQEWFEAHWKDAGEVTDAVIETIALLSSNSVSSPALAEKKREEIRVLISTDVLSEGLNLQDASRMINYDIHWNPVRLMQRIGRVDRRMNPEVEKRLVADPGLEGRLMRLPGAVFSRRKRVAKGTRGWN